MVIPYAVASPRCVQPIEMKEWIAELLQKNGWHVSLDQRYKNAFIDVTAEMGSTVGLVEVCDLYNCRPDTVTKKIRCARSDLRKAAQDWKGCEDFNRIETYELYVNCLPLNVLYNSYCAKNGITGTWFYPHPKLCDGKLYLLRGGEVARAIARC